MRFFASCFLLLATRRSPLGVKSRAVVEEDVSSSAQGVLIPRSDFLPSIFPSSDLLPRSPSSRGNPPAASPSLQRRLLPQQQQQQHQRQSHRRQGDRRHWQREEHPRRKDAEKEEEDGSAYLSCRSRRRRRLRDHCRRSCLTVSMCNIPDDILLFQ